MDIQYIVKITVKQEIIYTLHSVFLTSSNCMIYAHKNILRF